MSKEQELILAVMIVMALCCITEVIIVGVSYFAADEVKCNWFWCEFTTTRTVTRQSCYENGEQINCSQLAKQMEWVIPDE